MDSYFIVDYNASESNEILNFKFKYGKLYLFFSNELGIQGDVFNAIAEKVSFINSFFKSAIKVPIYFEENKKELLKIKDDINISGTFPFRLEEYGLFDEILLVLLAELKKVNIAIVETTGLNESSIIKLIKFSFLYLELNPEKSIILIDNNYSNVNTKIILKIDKENIDKNLDEWLPDTLKSNKILIDFKLKL
ncbi:hypothetical protein HDF24_11430 [Mucilaginibacter sp. X4EP1]|uniref:hypothetical protein n=1 Tax=Mucilaginibacter sp. X4EP1 TaxID=2723092 RepID=UPI0021696082|nr:hypothetical protein [Mucilaginibacter sp. X4EP1]MCS3816619.1 hypothetical protein [Mucilaginibacter sp. X4EP1]